MIARRRRVVPVLLLAPALVAVLAGCPGPDAPDDASPTATLTADPTPEETPEEPTETPTETPSGEPAQTPSEEPAGVVPGMVGDVDAGRGGVSGDFVVQWAAVADATGYRVYRASAEGGPFTPAAEIDVATGEDTALVPGVMVWALPPDEGLQWYEYVETSTGTAWFRVTALGPGGEGPASAAVSADPL